jgi:hypothetical protein
MHGNGGKSIRATFNGQRDATACCACMRGERERGLRLGLKAPSAVAAGGGQSRGVSGVVCALQEICLSIMIKFQHGSLKIRHKKASVMIFDNIID